MNKLTFEQIRSLNPCKVIDDVKPWFDSVKLESTSLEEMLYVLKDEVDLGEAKRKWQIWFENRMPELASMINEEVSIKKFLLFNPLIGQHEEFNDLELLKARREVLLQELLRKQAELTTVQAEIAIGVNSILYKIPFKENDNV